MGFIVFFFYLICMAFIGDNLLPSLVVGGFGAYGAALFIESLLAGRKLAQLNQWPTAKGTIVEFEMERDLHYTGPKMDKTLSGSFDWTPSIRYRYETGGASYESRNFFSNSVGTRSYKKKDLPEITRSLRVGTSVPVYFNPTDPSDSFIAHPNNKNGALTGLTLAVVCAYLVINNGFT